MSSIIPATQNDRRLALNDPIQKQKYGPSLLL